MNINNFIVQICTITALITLNVVQGKKKGILNRHKTVKLYLIFKINSVGSVKCQCDNFFSVDTSPEKALFPGETCNYECSTKICLNEGKCLYTNGMAKCYCLNRFVGESCEIDIFCKMFKYIFA